MTRKRAVTFAYALAIIGMVLPAAIHRAPFKEYYGWLDWTALAGFGLLRAWLTSVRARSAESGPDEGFALRA